MDLPDSPPPPIHSNKQDLLLDNRPEHGASVLIAYADSDWATCVKTRRSFGGSCLWIAIQNSISTNYCWIFHRGGIYVCLLHW
jgi:hypothetical protein